MILLDTHIWVWWVHGDPSLSISAADLIQEHESQGLGISVISCWEVAKSCQLKRLALPTPLHEWMRSALAYPGIELLPITPEIAIESTRLPGSFHRDPADQLLVATARIHDIPLLTSDGLIRGYPHVVTLP